MATTAGRTTKPAHDSGAQRARTEAGDAPLDALLSDAAVSPGRRWVPGLSAAKATVRLGLRPKRVARRAGGLTAELARIAAGRSQVAPDKSDRRFKDAAWEGNPLFRRLGQAYLAAGGAAHGLVDDAELSWGEERRLQFAVDNIVAALSPTNFPLLNPLVLKAIIDTGGTHLLRGTGQLVRDMATPPRLPSMVDRSKFKVGENLAVTPGAVVARTPVFELIQYRPSTALVREQPLLIVPPMINKYYVTDLAPERSLAEHLVKAGQQVFTISWRNPDERASGWNLDTYVSAVLDALEAVERVSGSAQTHVLGLCAGGIVSAITAAHLAAAGQLERIRGLTLGVCVIDNARAGTTAAFADRHMAAVAAASSARRGYLDGRALAGVFAWLRPTDLIWNYWVNNYLLGKNPPAFDILYWNSDTTNLPAALHRDFLRLSLDNTLVRPGRTRVLGTPIDLSKITTDSYLVAGIADHITPWQSSYRTTQLLGSSPRFVLSTSGHIAAVVNPPSNEKASYRLHDGNPEDPQQWLEQATQHRGSWWEDWLPWLSERSGEERAPRKRLGGGGLKVLGDAPGTYVHNA